MSEPIQAEYVHVERVEREGGRSRILVKFSSNEFEDESVEMSSYIGLVLARLLLGVVETGWRESFKKRKGYPVSSSFGSDKNIDKELEAELVEVDKRLSE